MNFLEQIKMSCRVLRTNRNRTFLTTLGIIIGVAAVMVIMSVGAGAQSLIFDQIASAGSNLIGVLPGYSDEKGPPASAMGITVTTLKQEDAEAMKKIKEIEAVASYVRGVDTVQWQNQKVDATYLGVTADYPQVESAEVEIGSFFDESQDKGLARVTVLGFQTAADLFGGQNPLGEQIRIKRENFRVIGVVKKRGVVGFQNQDNLVLVPLETAQKLLLGIEHISMLHAKVRLENDVPAVMAQMKEILREQHQLGPGAADDFSVRATVEALEALKTITNALRFFLSGIAAISLIVGGVGIMNIMLVAVNERTREIGLRLALGATKKNIQTQFLTETLVLTILGGCLGILSGVSFSGLIAFVANFLGYHWAFVITLPSILMGVAVASFVGIIFGWYPARHAANLEPVEALRYE